MQKVKLFISLFFIATYGLGFVHELAPHCSEVFNPCEAITAKGSHHHHGHEHHEGAEITHDDHHDHGIGEFLACLLNDFAEEKDFNGF